MAITEKSKAHHEKMFPGYHSTFLETNPEFIERFDNFDFDEVVNSDNLDGKTRMMAILTTLIGCQRIDEFKAMLPAAMNFGVAAVEIKEIVYQAVAYLGIGRTFSYLHAVNEECEKQGIPLPLEGQANTTMENRLEAGEQAQIDIMGGCEPQLTSHAAANMRIGNTKEFLIKIIFQCIPFIGYPRSLNALRCVNVAASR